MWKIRSVDSVRAGGHLRLAGLQRRCPDIIVFDWLLADNVANCSAGFLLDTMNDNSGTPAGTACSAKKEA